MDAAITLPEQIDAGDRLLSLDANRTCFGACAAGCWWVP